MFTPVLLLMALTFWPVLGFTDTGREQIFTSGLESFKRSELAQSREQFTQLLKQNPEDPALLYNLGLVELTDKHPGRALGYWRKALYLKPGYSPSLAGLKQLRKSNALPQLESAGWLDSLYLRIPVSVFLAATLILFVLSGFLWVRFLKHKKNELPAPMAGALASLFFFLLFASLSAHGSFSLYGAPKATVMADAVPVYSSPSLEAPSLFEFREGDEVIVHRAQQDWVQVERSATSIGWVKKDQIFYHSGI